MRVERQRVQHHGTPKKAWAKDSEWVFDMGWQDTPGFSSSPLSLSHTSPVLLKFSEQDGLVQGQLREPGMMAPISA